MRLTCRGCGGEKMAAAVFGLMRRCSDYEGRGTARVLTPGGRLVVLVTLASLTATMSSRCPAAEPLLGGGGNHTGVVLLTALRPSQGLPRPSATCIDQEER